MRISDWSSDVCSSDLPIDPVRYIANRSSGRQGFAIAGALAAEGAAVTLIAGPVTLDTPVGVERVDVETAQEMANAVAKALPADAAVLVAAVADWRTDAAPQQIRPDERRGGKEGVSTCRSRWSP